MKKSVHLSAKTERFINNRALDDSPNFSGQINSAIEVLTHLAQAEKPALSNSDWTGLYNAYAGSDLTRLALPLNLARDLLAHYGATVPSQLPDQQALIEQLVKMTQAQQYAIIDAVRVFWAAQ